MHTVPFDEREIDIFFAGSLAEPAARPESETALSGGTPSAIDLLYDTIEELEKTGAPVLPALLEILKRRGMSSSDMTRDVFAEVMTLALKICELNRRFEILTALPDDFRIAIAADYLPKALCDRPNVTYLGYIDDFDTIRGHMRNARIVLNTTSKFPAGSHERIWYAMADGAVVLTDSSAFMKPDFADGENIIYLPQKRLDKEDLAAIMAIARDTAKLTRMADSASARYSEKHSWEKRAPLLITAMRAA